MAEGYEEAYHVPQQSRRDKLRVVLESHPAANSIATSSCCLDLQPEPSANHHLQAALLPLHGPSFLPSDLLSCSLSSNPIKHEASHSSSMGGYVGVGLMMNHINNNNASSSTSQHPHPHRHPYPHLDPLGHLNPNSQIQDINTASSAFLFTNNNPQNLNLRDFGGDDGGGEVVVHKPDALSVTHHQDQSNHTQAALSLSLSSLYYNHYHHHPHQNLPLDFHRSYGSPIINDKIIPATISVPAAADGGDGGSGGYLIPPAVSGGIKLSGSAIRGDGGGSAASSYDLSASSVRLGHFTGYASILKGSKFLKPTQQLLEDYCTVGQRINIDAPWSSSMDSSLDSLGRTDIIDDEIEFSSLGRADGKKSRLIYMLNEVYRKYRQYYHQMQAAVTSFESICGLGNAAPYAHLALKAMNKHFRCLKNAITDQLQFASKTHGKDVPKIRSSDEGYRQRSVHSPGFIDNQPAWRPQRGLPERAVTVLRAWLFEHFLHPYPADTDKMMLAKQTGLSRNQVSNWFINARVRLWKPMVEEIHSLETRQGQRTSEWEEQNTDRASDHIPSSGTSATAHPSSTQRNQDTPYKRTRNEFDAASRTDESSINWLSYGHFPSHLQVGGGGASTQLPSSSVCLSLGPHPNNGIVFSEAFPINPTQRFGLGLDAPSDGYAMNSFETQAHQFG